MEAFGITYTTKVDQKYRGDIRKKGDWTGPNEPFKVIKAGTESRYGGAVTIEFRDGRRILFGHFDQINIEIMNAYHNGDELPAGTYLGRIESQIGNSSGPHLHIEDPRQKADRETLLQWLKGKKK